MDDTAAGLRRRLFDAAARMRKQRQEPPTPKGITSAEMYAIMAVSRLEGEGRKVRSGDIAKCGQATPSAVSQTLKSLEEKGLIVRRRGEGDSRSVTISLTNAGHEFEKEGRRLHDERFMHMLEFLGEDDAREFVRIVNRMLEFEESHPWKDAAASNALCCEKEGGEPCA